METTGVFISYVPLLIPVQGEDWEDSMKRANSYMESDIGDVEGCVWFIEDSGDVACAFVIDRAKEIADHLHEWAEKDPTSWFTLQHGPIIHEECEGFTVRLFPNMKKVIERINARLVLEGKISHESQFVKDAKIIFKMISYEGDGQTYLNVRDKIGKKMQISFIDEKNIKNRKIDPTDIFNHLIPVGRFDTSLID